MAYAFIIALNDYNIYIKYYKGTPNNTNAIHGFTKVCLKKMWFYHVACSRNAVLPWLMPKKHGITQVHAKKTWYYHGRWTKTWLYHGTCPKNIVLPRCRPKKHGITKVRAQKNHGSTNDTYLKTMVLPCYLSRSIFKLAWELILHS